jgi:hypothetical protein
VQGGTGKSRVKDDKETREGERRGCLFKSLRSFVLEGVVRIEGWIRKRAS